MFLNDFEYNTFFGDFMQNFMQVYGVALVYSALILIFKVLFMVAIGYDCKSRGDSRQAMWMVLCFFFPLIAGVVYGCTRNKNNSGFTKTCPECGGVWGADANFCPNCRNSNMILNAPMDSAKNKSTSKVFFGVSVAFYIGAVIAYVVFIMSIVSIAIGTVDYALDYGMTQLEDLADDDIHYGYYVDGNTLYYDREGNSYSDDEDVSYYDEDGTIYKYDEDDYSFVSQTGERYDDFYCYVNRDGYFYFDSQDYHNFTPAITYYDSADEFRDEDGNVYYYANDVSWDSEGNLVDNNFGNLLD